MVRVKISDDQYFKSYRIKLYPTIEQSEYIDRCIELNRYIYNWCIEQEENQMILFDEGKADKRFLTMYELDKRFTELRNSTEWIKALPHNSGRSAIRRCIKGYHRFFNGTSRKPVYKTKKDKYGKSTLKSFTTRSDRMFFIDNMLRIEGLPKDDMIFTKYHTKWNRNSCKFYSPVISKNNLGEYYISFSIIEYKPRDYFEENNIPSLGIPIGIDLNVKKRMVLSNGKIYYAPDIDKYVKKAYKYNKLHQKDVKRYSVAGERTNLSDEDIPYSNRALKRMNIMRKEYKKIHYINDNFIKTSVREIINMNPTAIVMEDLDIVGDMQKRHYIAKQIVFANFYNIRKYMEYKCDLYGIQFVLAPKGYESTQICSCCGHKRKMYSQKTYICPHCGARIDRDINAAINLSRLA